MKQKPKNQINKPDFQRLDRPVSLRVPHRLHARYKACSGYDRKRISFLFVAWLEKEIKKIGVKP